MAINNELYGDKIQIWQYGLRTGVVTRDQADFLLMNEDYHVMNSQSIEWRRDQ